MATMRTARILGFLLPAAQCLELQSRAVVLRDDPFGTSLPPAPKNDAKDPFGAFLLPPSKNETKKQASLGREKTPSYVLATEYAGYQLCHTGGTAAAAHFSPEYVQAQAPEYSWGTASHITIVYVDTPEECAMACAAVDGCAYFTATIESSSCGIYANCSEASKESALEAMGFKIYALAGASGDPHLRNLAGEKFDVNQPGNYLLLRVPKQPTKPALLELRGAVMAAGDAPCGLYLKTVTLAGEWLGGKHLEVRSLKGKSFQGTWPNGWPFAIRTSTKPKAQGKWKSWENFTAEGSAEDSLPDTVKVTTRFRKEEAAAGRVMEAMAFELHVGTQAVQERPSIIVAQGSHEGLDISLAKMSLLHEPSLGGLLGTDMHDKKVEIRTAECEASAKQPAMKRLAMTAGGSRFTASWV